MLPPSDSYRQMLLLLPVLLLRAHALIDLVSIRIRHQYQIMSRLTLAFLLYPSALCGLED